MKKNISSAVRSASRIYNSLPPKGVDFRKVLKVVGYRYVREGFLAVKEKKRNCVVVEALHGFKEKGHRRSAETRTAKIAHVVSELSGADCVLALKSRAICDLNRGSKARKSIHFSLKRKLQKRGALVYADFMNDLMLRKVESNKKKSVFLVLSIHGMRNRKMREIDLGSGRGKLCRKSIALWFGKEIRRRFKESGLYFRVNVDKGFTGGAHPKVLREKKYLGKRVQYLQVELNKRIRKKFTPEISAILAGIIRDFGKIRWLPKKSRRRIGAKKRKIMIEGKLKIMNIEDGGLKAIYIDRSQRVCLGTRKGRFVELLLGSGKTVKLKVQPAKYVQIGENKIVLASDLAEKLNLKNGCKLKIINKVKYEKAKSGNS